MICGICGKKGARIRRVTRTMGRGKATFLIEKVPQVTCPACGESYYTAETLKEIERIRLHWRELTVQRKFPLATFGPAA